MDFLDLELRHDFKYSSLIVKAAVSGRAIQAAVLAYDQIGFRTIAVILTGKAIQHFLFPSRLRLRELEDGARVFRCSSGCRSVQIPSRIENQFATGSVSVCPTL